MTVSSWKNSRMNLKAAFLSSLVNTLQHYEPDEWEGCGLSDDDAVSVRDGLAAQLDAWAVRITR